MICLRQRNSVNSEKQHINLIYKTVNAWIYKGMTYQVSKIRDKESYASARPWMLLRNGRAICSATSKQELMDMYYYRKKTVKNSR